MKDFTPRYGGFLHFTRKKIILQHYRPLPNTILGGILTSLLPAIFVTDRSYIYTENSSKFQFQRRSYSMHKYWPRAFVNTTGYIHVRNVIELYLADLKITMPIQRMKEIRPWLKEK